MVNREELRELCKRLNLHHLSKINTFDLDIKDKLDYFKYLLEYEIQEREKKVKKHNLSSSHLPNIKSDNKYEGIDEWNINDVKKLNWFRNNQNLIIVGKCGIGKTAIAVDIAKTAINEKYKVYYLCVDEYLRILKNENDPKSKIAHTKMKDADLIIVDEMIYLPIDASDIVMLYRSIMYFNQARSFIFITNRRLEEWTDTNEDKHTMETFTERLMNGSRILMLSKK